MPRGKIYSPQQDELYKLLESGWQDGATLVIPDLQRPYTWGPRAVIMLVDSLLRGWPFGTLLLWGLNTGDGIEVPARAFWKTYDPDDIVAPTASQRAQAPTSYQMVLDGQQRLQSLILAVGEGEFGFRLWDADWADLLDKDRPRGSSKQWSLGQLSLDLDEFQRQYESPAVSHDVTNIDYTTALKWVIWGHNGKSANAPVTYQSAIDSATNPSTDRLSGRYIRLGRLWRMARVDSTPESKYRNQLTDDVLPAHEVLPARAALLTSGLAEFLSRLGAVKGIQVSFLKLEPFSGAEMGDTERKQELERYEDAIVNIFTRLNKAGTPLTDQEITFAWIKQNWNKTKTGGRSASDCFKDLQDELRDQQFDLPMDDLVSSAASLWSVFDNGGIVLKAADLLKPAVLKPMASGLDYRWGRFAGQMVESAEMLSELRLNYGRNFESLYALNILWAWRMLGAEWASTNGRPHLDTASSDDHEKELDAMFKSLAPRWIALTHWGGVWRNNARDAFAKYMSELNQEWRNIQSKIAPKDVQNALKTRMTAWLDALKPESNKYVDALGVDRREDVRRYYLALWVWHRLTASRAAESAVVLREGRRKAETYDVDHVVSYKLWERVIGSAPKSESTPADSAVPPLANVNELGNMLLMQKNFNIAKKEKPLIDFLKKINEFSKAGPTKKDIPTWGAEMSLQDPQLNPPTKSDETERIKAVHAAVRERTRRMKTELKQFVDGMVCVVSS